MTDGPPEGHWPLVNMYDKARQERVTICECGFKGTLPEWLDHTDEVTNR